MATEIEPVLSRSATRADASGDAAQRAYQELKTKIVLGHFQSGSRLTEASLSSMLGVSRTPIRAALVRLDAEGLVDLSPKRSAVVSSNTVVGQDELFQIREALEVRAASTAAAVLGDEALYELEDLTTRMESVIGGMGASMRNEFARLESEFHFRLADASLRQRMAVMIGDLGTLSESISPRRTQPLPVLRRFVSQHRELIVALGARDIEWAASAMSSHLRAMRLVADDPDTEFERTDASADGGV